ncbi:MAG: preprotein translocase subunit SecG [Marinoscillum sp.]|jgi:preprotein translocase subunit SecG
MYALIIGIIILVAFLLILIVLAQNPKGGGLSSQFGGAGTQQIMGVKKTGDILEKLTWGLAIALLTLTLSTNFFIERDTTSISSPNIESAQETILPSQSVPSAAGDLQDLGLEGDSTN